MSDEEFPLLSGKLFNIASRDKSLTVTSPGTSGFSISGFIHPERSLVVGLS